MWFLSDSVILVSQMSVAVHCFTVLVGFLVFNFVPWFVIAEKTDAVKKRYFS